MREDDRKMREDDSNFVIPEKSGIHKKNSGESIDSHFHGNDRESMDPRMREDDSNFVIPEKSGIHKKNSV